MEQHNNYPTTEIDVTTPSYSPGWQCFRFNIHNFESLPAVVDKPLDPILFSCFGRNWKLKLYIGGKPSLAPHMAGQLAMISGDPIEVDMKFSANKENRHVKVNKSFSEENDHASFKLHPRQQYLDNAERYLTDGTLTLTFYFKDTSENNLPARPFVPQNPCSSAILSLFNDEQSADVLFEVSESIGDSDTMTMRIYAHRLILQSCSPALAELCGDCTNFTRVPINGIKSEIFEALVGYVYGRQVPPKDMQKYCKDLMSAADLYGIVNLKVEAEAAYVQFTKITIDNVVDNFYLADTKKCALLKEKVMEFFVENGQEVMAKLSFKDAPESATMFNDFMAAVALGKSKDKNYDGDDTTKFKCMSVNSLRRKLSERGLNIDGTREMMIAALELSYAKSGDKRKRDGNDSSSS